MGLEVSFGIGIVVLLVLLLVFYHLVSSGGTRKHRHWVEHLDTAGFAAQVKVVGPADQIQQKSYGDMTEGEKVQFIIDTFFSQQDDDGQAAETRSKEDAYINSLPTSDQGCTDDYDDCAIWAANGECTINPEYMLYACPKSCKACALTPQQKHNVTVIYNQHEPARCVSHGENYPGNFPYINRMYDYNVHYE
jgi:hypothetical protein